MRLNSRIILLLIAAALSIMGQAVCFGQSPNIQITKKKCTYDSKYFGEKLIMHYQDNAVNLTSSNDYWLDSFVTLSDTSKLLMVERLLSYESDTALCCLKLTNWNFGGGESCKSASKNIKRYTIQVDALYMINRLCWPKSIDFYSCSPTLYDSKTKTSINSDQEKIKCVFEDYKKWYAECKAKGKISRYFPFNDGRYVWYGGRKSLAPKD